MHPGLGQGEGLLSKVLGAFLRHRRVDAGEPEVGPWPQQHAAGRFAGWWYNLFG